MQGLQQGLQSKGKQQWPQRVALLNPSLRGDGSGAKKQVARRAVAPLGPFGKLRKVVPALLEEGLSIHAIKGISEVDFDKNGTAGIAMPMPL